MTAPLPVPWLIAPVAVWIATGLGLAVALRRSSSHAIVRLGATFAALWSLLATTALIGLVSLGGWDALERLTASPTILLAPDHWTFWAFGAIGTFLLLTLAFLLNQLVGRGLLHVLDPRPLAWPVHLERPAGDIELRAFASPERDAFSFTLAETSGALHRRELILLSDGLLAALTAEEVEAVVAHELGHIRDLDSRYLTFCRTFSRMMRWDPVLAYLAWAMTRQEEYRADLLAARTTHRPRALARALYKVLLDPRTGAATQRGVAALLGVPGRRRRAEALRRIERLLELADSPEFREEPRAP